jgi:hypothetical protein
MKKMNGRLLELEPGIAFEKVAGHVSDMNRACERFFEDRGLYAPSWREMILGDMKTDKRRRISAARAGADALEGGETVSGAEQGFVGKRPARLRNVLEEYDQ